jgi:glycosyltransferase involved in cell wall biosynthesis
MGLELERLGHVVELVSLDDPNEAFINEFPLRVHAMGPSYGNYGYNAKLVPWLKARARGYDAVIINGLWSYQSFGTWRALRTGPVPYYVYTHGMLDPWFKSAYPIKHLKKWLYWPWAEYRVLRDARAVLFTSEEERRLARQSFWLYRAQERVVAFGTSAPPGDSARLRERFLATHPELRDRRVLLFLGRIHEKKGCDLLIRAFASVAIAEPKLHLVIAGPDQMGWVARLTTLAGELDIADRISWPGMVRDEMKWGAFYSAEAFVLSSHQENFGIAVAEALGCGVPVLISNKVNIWREIEAAGAGLIDTDSESGTERLFTRWLAMSAADRQKMSVSAQELFRRQFTAAAMTEGLLRVIEQQRSDSDLTRYVAFVGPLPPPLHGFSSVSATMLNLLRQRASVQVFDRARRSNSRAGQLLRQIFLVFKYIGLCFRERDLTLYLALSGGRSQLLDSLYLLVSKIFHNRAIIHHHSFAYVNSSTLINKVLFSLIRNQTHIVLSRRMATALTNRYRLDERKLLMVSNAAYFAEAPVNPRPARSDGTEAPVRVGFLSNITFDKGFIEFFDVLTRLRSLNVEYRAYVAGPVAPEARQSFYRLCATDSHVEYVGAVYDEAKEHFYQQLDVLLFPTKYANEAEPLVIHEALRSGVYVIACDRGAIAETLGNQAGRVFLSERFVDSAAECICSLSADRDKLIQGQRLAFAQAQRLHISASMELAEVLKCLASNIVT